MYGVTQRCGRSCIWQGETGENGKGSLITEGWGSRTDKAGAIARIRMADRRK